MTYLKTTLFLTGLFLTYEATAQSGNSFIAPLDSIEIDIYNNYESDKAPFDLHKLREPTLFILNGQELEISAFSELNLGEGEIESVTIIQDPNSLQVMGYSSYHSMVKVQTKENE
jgi:hypothetical protein